MADRKPVPAKTEVFAWSTGKITGHWLPCEQYPHGTEKQPLLIIKRNEYLYVPVGAGDIMDLDGQCWGSHMLFSCVLISPRRFVQRNGSDLLAGKPDREILADTLRETFRTTMSAWLTEHSTKEAEQHFNDLQEQIEDACRIAAISNGWMIEEVKRGKVVKTI